VAVRRTHRGWTLLRNNCSTCRDFDGLPGCAQRHQGTSPASLFETRASGALARHSAGTGIRRRNSSISTRGHSNRWSALLQGGLRYLGGGWRWVELLTRRMDRDEHQMGCSSDRPPGVDPRYCKKKAAHICTTTTTSRPLFRSHFSARAGGSRGWSPGPRHNFSTRRRARENATGPAPSQFRGGVSGREEEKRNLRTEKNFWRKRRKEKWSRPPAKRGGSPRAFSSETPLISLMYYIQFTR